MKHAWEYKRFDECIEKVKYTSKLQTKDYLSDGDIPIVSQEERLISGYTNNTDLNFHHERPVVIFGDHTRCVKYVDFDFCLGADGVKILSPIERFVPKFFYYLIKAAPIENLGYSRHFRLLHELLLPIPSQIQQIAIVSELDKINEAIASKQKQLKHLDELVKSQFIEMFGNPVSNNKNWKCKRLDEIAPEKPASTTQTGKVWNLNLDMVESQTGRIIDKVYNDIEKLNSIHPFDNENVLFSKLRPYLNKVVIPDEYGYCTTELVPLRPNSKILNRVFLGYLLRSDDFVSFANGITAGAKMPRMRMEALRSFNCILPSIELQQQFAAIVNQADKSKAILREQIAQLQTLLASRMDYWFND